jgi:hypothetical protein
MREGYRIGQQHMRHWLRDRRQVGRHRGGGRRSRRGTEVKDKLVGAECGTEGEAGIIVAARGTGEVVEVI